MRGALDLLEGGALGIGAPGGLFRLGGSGGILLGGSGFGELEKLLVILSHRDMIDDR